MLLWLIIIAAVICILLGVLYNYTRRGDPLSDDRDLEEEHEAEARRLGGGIDFQGEMRPPRD